MGDRLRTGRTAASLTQEKLGEIAGVDRKTVVRLESATTDARIAVWLRLARAIGVPLAELVKE